MPPDAWPDDAYREQMLKNLEAMGVDVDALLEEHGEARTTDDDD